MLGIHVPGVGGSHTGDRRPLSSQDYGSRPDGATPSARKLGVTGQEERVPHREGTLHCDMSSQTPRLSLLTGRHRVMWKCGISLTPTPKLGTAGLWAPAPRSAHGKRRGGVGEWEQSIRDRDLLHPLHSHKSPLRSCLVRCQPADHSPPDLQARLSACECLHPHLQHPESPPFQGLPERKHATKCPIEVSAKSRHSVSSSQQSASRAVAELCPLSSQVPRWQTTPTPSSSYFIETRYFSKIKALRRVDDNTLMKQED